MLVLSHLDSKFSSRSSLVQGILAHASRSDWRAGEPLREAVLAERFNVSRTPINRALRDLVDMGMAKHIPNRGFFLSTDATAINSQIRDLNSEDKAYLCLASDALEWGNGTNLTIADLATRYGEPRRSIQKILDRAALEGWVSRGAGYKWTITLGITSEADYAKFYRFREVIEPIAILEPEFHVDEGELAALLSLQIRLVAGEFQGLNAIDLFEINTELHETIVSWSGNHFFLDALRRSNASRRLLEYTKVLNTDHIDDFARDHIKILNLLKSGKTKRAAEQVRKHLGAAGKIKTNLSGVKTLKDTI